MSRTLFMLGIFGAFLVPLLGQEKIIGGRRAPRRKAPYLVSIMHNLRHECGGSIIGRKIVLTAAHCVVKRGPRNLAVRAGSNYRRQGGFVARVASWRKHPKFNSRSLNYDLAIVYLRENFPFNKSIKPIKLFHRRLRRLQKGVIVGWGNTRENGRAANYLQIAPVRITPRKKCRRAYGRSLKRTMYCAGFMSGTHDACQGDSGGPLVIKGRLAGIVSVGRGCGRRGFPGLYTRIPMLKLWVAKNRN